MKKSDIAMIVLIASVSVGIAYFVANSLFGGISEKGATIQTVDVITSEVEEPDPTIFNDEAINPSVEVQIDNPTQDEETTEEDPPTPAE